MVVDIVIPIAAAIIDIKRVEVDLWFHLATTALYQSLAGVVILGLPVTSLRTTVWMVWNWFHNYEMTEWWMQKKRATIVMDCDASNPSDSSPLLKIFHLSSGTHKNTSNLRTNHANSLDTIHLHTHATPVTPFTILSTSQSTAGFANFWTRNRDWLKPNIFSYVPLFLKQISAYLLQTGLQISTFSSSYLTFGSECNINTKCFSQHKVRAKSIWNKFFQEVF